MTPIAAKSFDHLALWVADVDGLAGFLCDHLGLHVIERGDDFSLVGAEAREGKLTLFEADGPRQSGAFGRVFLRVGDLAAAESRLPDGLARRNGDGELLIDGPQGVGLGLVEGEGLDYDLDHAVLRVENPDTAAAALQELGFERADGALAIGGRYLLLEEGGGGEVERPLLNHLALLVESASEVMTEAERRDLKVEKVVDAENTLAVFVRGPEGITVEYVEHKPSFSLT